MFERVLELEDLIVDIARNLGDCYSCRFLGEESVVCGSCKYYSKWQINLEDLEEYKLKFLELFSGGEA